MWMFIKSLLSAATEWDSEAVKCENVFKAPEHPERENKAEPSTPQSKGGVRLHEFVSKTVSLSLLFKIRAVTVWYFYGF